MKVLRKLVSGNKKRHVDKDLRVDLDLTYVTNNIIAMGFPAENMERIYRNKMSEVIHFLDSKHGTKYKVYNLCSERDYPTSRFHERVARYPFDDHNAPPFELIKSFCEDVDEWISKKSRLHGGSGNQIVEDILQSGSGTKVPAIKIDDDDKKEANVEKMDQEERVAVVHCKAGKGRTGLMICAYMVYSGLCSNYEEALQRYDAVRTRDRKGVTIPSQKRYVHYFDMYLKANIEYRPLIVELKTIVLGNINSSWAGMLDPIIKVTCGENAFMVKATKDLKPTNPSSTSPKTFMLTLILTPPYQKLQGDIKVQFFHRPHGLSRKPSSAFQFWLNTAFLPSVVGQNGDNLIRRVMLTRKELDKVKGMGGKGFRRKGKSDLDGSRGSCREGCPGGVVESSSDIDGGVGVGVEGFDCREFCVELVFEDVV
ncbi:hypothetical protein HDU76_013021 [Blyttiomyces sp. JEL0837]|nr:hypothetical protein HDU76_013021 [Blyttiomyces sp. JEL0837]